jgi:hypothetical protein
MATKISANPASARPSAQDAVSEQARQHERRRDGAEVDLESEHGDDPPRGGRAGVGAEHDAQRLPEGQQPRGHEADRRDRRRAAALHDGRDDRARGRAGRGAAREARQDARQRLAGGLAQAARHDRHPQQEQAQAAGDREPGVQDRRSVRRACRRPACTVLEIPGPATREHGSVAGRRRALLAPGAPAPTMRP